MFKSYRSSLEDLRSNHRSSLEDVCSNHRSSLEIYVQIIDPCWRSMFKS